jgi:hypothetical protein
MKRGYAGSNAGTMLARCWHDAGTMLALMPALT